MYLGCEVMGVKEVLVYVLLCFDIFLYINGLWLQLVVLNNIVIKILSLDSVFVLNECLIVMVMFVLYCDEFLEIAGFCIEDFNWSFFFIFDIDKWEQWDWLLVEEL